MKQLVLKELREQSRVALLGLAVFSVMLLLAFSASMGWLDRLAYSNGYSDAEGYQPLLSQSILTQAAFFCGIFGALLGWLQIRAEKHPDLWAFLLHRPISRTTILRSKVMSGLLLYAVAAGLPVFGFILVCSMPGKVPAPFEWRMALPLTAIFLVGVVHYFAGLLTGLRKARWYGSRGFGLGLAVMAALGVFVAREFWQALLMIVCSGAVLALAAWGSFKTGGYYRGQPGLSKVALAMASAVTVMMLMGLVIAMFQRFLWVPYDYTYSNFHLTKDGEVIKVTRSGRDNVEVVDLSGKPVTNADGSKVRTKDLQGISPAGLGATGDFEEKARKGVWKPGYAQARRFFFPWRMEEKTLWYLSRHGYLQGFDADSRREVARLAPTGGGPDDSRFLPPPNFYSSFQPYQMPHVMASARTAYMVNLEKRELAPFFVATNGDMIGGLAQQSFPMYPPSSNVVLIVTRESVRLMDFERRTRFVVPFEPGPPVYRGATISFLQGTNAYAVRFEPDYIANQEAGGNMPSHMQWLDSSGQVQKRMELPYLPVAQREGMAEKFLLVLLPLAFPFHPTQENFRVYEMTRVALAVVWAFVGWWLAGRANLSTRGKIGWSVFHVLFGIPGLIAFRAVQEWPAREVCPRCGKVRAVDREQCKHCGSDFAPPEKTGVEIFEPLRTS